MIDSGTCVGVGPSSGSVEVDVLVRYSAVFCTSAGDTHVAAASHFQTPKSGNNSWVKFAPHASSVTA